MWTNSVTPVHDYDIHVEGGLFVTVAFIQMLHTGDKTGLATLDGIIINETPNTISLQVYPRNTNREHIKGHTFNKFYFGPYTHRIVVIPKHLIQYVETNDLFILLEPSDMIEEAK